MDLFFTPSPRNDPFHRLMDLHKKIRPRQKAIIVSGFAETEQDRETLKSGAGRYLKKPLILEELGAALKEELYGALFIGQSQANHRWNGGSDSV